MRHVARTLAGLGLLLLLLVGAALVWRTQLVEIAGKRWLAGQGFDNASFTVRTIGPSRLVLSDIDLGEDAPRADEITANYAPRALLRGKLESLTIRGLRATVDPTAEQPLPWLPPGDAASPLSPTPAGTAAERNDVPRIVLRDAHITVEGLGAPELPVQLAGTLDPRNGLSARFTGRVRADFATAQLSGELTDLGSAPRGSIEGTIDADVAKLPRAWQRGLPLRAGRASLRLHHRGRLPALATPASPEETIANLGTTRVEAELRAADARPYAERLDARVDVAISEDDGALALTERSPLVLRTRGGDAGALAALGMPDAVARALSTHNKVELKPRAAGAPLLRLRPADTGWRIGLALTGEADIGATGTVSGDVAGHAMLDRALAFRRAEAETLDLVATGIPLPATALATAAYRGTARVEPAESSLQGTFSATAASASLAGATARDLRAYMPVTARFAAMQEATATLTEPGWLQVGELVTSGDARVGFSDRVTVPQADLNLTPEGVRAEAVVEPGRLRVAGLLDGVVGIDGGQIALSGERTDNGLRMQGDLTNAAAAYAEANLAARAISGRVEMPPGAPPRARLGIGSLRHTAPTPAFKPLTLNAEATRADGVYRMEGALALADGDARLPIEARHDPATGDGALRVRETAVRFAPGGLQPGALSPLLADATQVSGTVTPSAALTWGADGLQSHGRVTFDGLDATVRASTITDVNGTLTLESLMPPRTAGMQTLSAATVSAGLPLTDVTVHAALTPDDAGQPEVHVAQVSGTLADGRLTAKDIRWRPAEIRVSAPVQVSGVSLGKLLAAMKIEGVSGTGELLGTIPLRISDGTVLLDDGVIQAVDNGILRIDPTGAEGLKAGGGEYVTMMLNALTNFRYETFTIRVNRPAPGEMRAAITLAGNNPDVLEGYPFLFNVTVSGDMRPLLTALARGRSLSADLLQDAISLQ